MAQANDSVTITPGAGATIATHAPGDGKEYQVVMIADDSGHLQQSLPTYGFYIKAQAGGAAKDHFDLFNAVGSGKVLELRGLWVSPSLIAAVTGTLAPDFDFCRTSAVGTGGAALVMGAATFPSLHKLDTGDPDLPAGITVRAAPTGGATIDDALFSSYISQEETQAGSQLAQWQNLLPMTAMARRYTAREGQGFKLRQITAGVAQNFSFYGVFTAV